MDPVFYVLRPYAHETILIGAAAIGFTVGTMQPKGHAPKLAILTLETDDVRYWLDGTDDPTATVGHLLSAGQALFCWHGSIGRTRLIRANTAQNDAVASVTYYD